MRKSAVKFKILELLTTSRSSTPAFPPLAESSGLRAPAEMPSAHMATNSPKVTLLPMPQTKAQPDSNPHSSPPLRLPALGEGTISKRAPHPPKNVAADEPKTPQKTPPLRATMPSSQAVERACSMPNGISPACTAFGKGTKNPRPSHPAVSTPKTALAQLCVMTRVCAGGCIQVRGLFGNKLLLSAVAASRRSFSKCSSPGTRAASITAHHLLSNSSISRMSEPSCFSPRDAESYWARSALNLSRAFTATAIFCTSAEVAASCSLVAAL